VTHTGQPARNGAPPWVGSSVAQAMAQDGVGMAAHRTPSTRIGRVEQLLIRAKSLRARSRVAKFVNVFHRRLLYCWTVDATK